MIEVIIQLIIVIVIIVSVMKRFREIAGKSKDLEKSPLPKPALDLFDVETPEEEPPVRPFPSLRPETLPKPRPVTPSWEVSSPEEESATIDENTFESRSEIQISESRFPAGVTQAGSSIPKTRTLAERPRATISPERHRPYLPVLRFNQNQVVRGIIMSEILGPPVGLREQARIR